MTDTTVAIAAKRFAEESKKEYGELLKQVILFGSCARGDFDEDSDIDVMVLLGVDEDRIIQERDRILSVIHRLDDEFDYEVLFSPVVQCESVFERGAEVIPFYSNVKKEGNFLII